MQLSYFREMNILVYNWVAFIALENTSLFKRLMCFLNVALTDTFHIILRKINIKCHFYKNAILAIKLSCSALLILLEYLKFLKFDMARVLRK